MIHEVSIAVSGDRITATVLRSHWTGSMSRKTDDGVERIKRERKVKVNRKFIVLLVIHPRRATVLLCMNEWCVCSPCVTRHVQTAARTAMVTYHLPYHLPFAIGSLFPITAIACHCHLCHPCLCSQCPQSREKWLSPVTKCQHALQSFLNKEITRRRWRRNSLFQFTCQYSCTFVLSLCSFVCKCHPVHDVQTTTADW